ncbi:MAG: hypothetical protein E7001_03675 [Coriobacteriaceae bacterium]|nr:hypothetical protein [Coriobacteriaceae bacterium]
MAKRKRSDAAARGTKADPERAAAREGTGTGEGAGRGGAAIAPAMDTPREHLTRRIFTTVQVMLVVIPFVHLGFAGVLNAGAAAMESLRVMLEQNPAFLVSFIAELLQPFAAYLVRIAYRHYAQGDAGYAAGNLVVLLCAELLMQNMVGVVGMAVLLWRTWGRAADVLGPWARERSVGGVLADVSGALVTVVLAALLAFANARLGG